MNNQKINMKVKFFDANAFVANTLLVGVLCGAIYMLEKKVQKLEKTIAENPKEE